MISTEGDNEGRSAIYLDAREARRLANAEFSLQSYEHQRQRVTAPSAKADGFPRHALPTRDTLRFGGSVRALEC